MPGGVELTRETERYLALSSDTDLLSVACGTGELELYLTGTYGCRMLGVDVDPALVERARRKATARELKPLARFVVGDGSALPLRAEAFDVVFCSGALCAFFQAGLEEFHRVLRQGGRAAILEVTWLHEPIPDEILQYWTGGDAEILTVEANSRVFEERGFKVHYARAYHEPSWWEAYYADRGDAPHWQEERAHYIADQDSLGLGAYVIEKM